MKQIKETVGKIMKTILNIIEPFKKVLIALAIIVFILVVIPSIMNSINEYNANQTPIQTIKATNSKMYSKSEKISPSDFKVQAIHENGKSSSVSSSDIKLSQNRVNNTGKITLVEISLKEDERIKTTIKIKNKRDKIAEIPCGKPKISDVKAVLYSNGELCFEGNGNIRNYPRREFPWMSIENAGETMVTAISFEKGVKPESMDYWFENMESIEYVENIPLSVKSAVNTFMGCTELTYAPAMIKNKNLINTENMYADCKKLSNAPELPINLRIADGMFQGCKEIQEAPKMSLLSSLQSAKSMFDSCEQLITGDISPNLIDAESMYANCINLKESPNFPDTIRNVNSCFRGNSSLVSPSAIPKGVYDISNCYTDCQKLSGILTISGNPSLYSGFLSGASRATKLDLQGESKILDVLANTSDGNDNITVNGKSSVKDAGIDDQIELTEE